ncbi:MAG TPA: TetR/AcrR family transcriptional regulator [Mycobacteriales bacterium]|nr:TetR/AcrR family transcriptional regulator [Mycobacteriales bacterium]
MSEVKGVSRRDRAARTRTAIVRAATEEFCRSGYHGATMASVAKRAGVAVQTVYFVFHTKPALLTAAIDAAVLGDEGPVPPELTPWWREATTTGDGRRAVELFVANVAEISTRAAALDQAAQAAVSTDPEVVHVLAHHESLREQGFADYVGTLAARGLLREGLDLAEATDVLLTLTGSSVFLDFTEGRGWPVERYVTWTSDVLATLFLAKPARGRARPR